MLDIIINALRMVMNASETNPSKAIYILQYLEKKYHKSEVKIIHLSTDCVFSGKMEIIRKLIF